MMKAITGAPPRITGARAGISWEGVYGTVFYGSDWPLYTIEPERE